MTLVLAAICAICLMLIDTAKLKHRWHEDQPLSHLNDDYIRAFQKEK